MNYNFLQSVFVVWGAPGSGKTTFVHDSLLEGDIVVDLDTIAAALLATDDPHPDYSTVLPLVLGVRDTLYSLIESRTGSWERAFIITSSPNENTIDQLVDRLGAKCIYMDITEEEALKRVDNDPSRPDKEAAKGLVKEWKT